MASFIRKYSYYLASIPRLLTGIREWPLVLGVFLGLAPEGEKTFRLRASGITLMVRGPMDLWSVKEAFLDRFYERYGTSVQDGWMVVDIGAGIGEFTLEVACKCPHCRIYAFEPFAESLALLQKNLRLNGMTNVQAFPEAIGERTGSLLLDLSGGEPLQLRSLQAEGGHPAQDARLVPSLSLADALDRSGIRQVDLLKVDCEGAEYPIFFNASAETLSRIRRIVMEYHDLANGPTHRDLVRFFDGRGYRVRTIGNPVHDHLGYLYAWREAE
jgi:FkbM family methyltransferase